MRSPALADSPVVHPGDSRTLQIDDSSAGPSSIMRDRRTEVLAAIIRDRAVKPVRRALVVGCGSGKEAAVLAGQLDTEVIGIDIQGEFDRAAARVVELRRGDATCMSFGDKSFDCVYSFHALEHIPDYHAALAEMRRVLADGGLYCIGTPNRHRLLGYAGSAETPWRTKLAWNIVDWKARIRGRFRNEFGAHAGYSAEELKDILAGAFGDAEEISLGYYRGVYRRQAALMSLLDATGLGRFAFPAVYFLGRVRLRR